ncbi:transmembrane protein-like [Tropilaelaps mercedesae]|uniref:ER membrane protein complex subunit 3 n=1 Tax=Tropilaelaps mercedesae TaxID=418985 RepID=A0A1V9XJ57_9ACAR|nr:transmembrane protein-like [Tropilaelaps mercedesae]
MVDLVLDRDIRIWVFLPIVVIMFFVGIVRHYVSILLTSSRKAELQQVYDSQALIRVRYLRENGKYLPARGFFMRKHFFNDEESGWLKTQKRPPPINNPMSDPGMMSEMLKGNLTNVLPMIVIGGWINWTFSGFLTTKVPFPLTLRFKPMLQRGIELASLDASWVSSASWYFLNVFGLRSIYALVLGEDNAADSTRAMQDSMVPQAAAMPQDSKAAFKAEWEALEVVDHKWALAGIEDDLCSKPLQF